MNIRKSVTAGLATVGVVALCGLYGCASCSREMKSINSDVNGGLERTVTPSAIRKRESRQRSR